MTWSGTCDIDGDGVHLEY